MSRDLKFAGIHDSFSDYVSYLSADKQAGIFAGNAERFYGLEP